MALVTDPAVKPVLDQQAVIINKLLQKIKLEDVEPLKITDDHTIKDFLYEKLSEYRVPSMSNVQYNEYAQAVTSDISFWLNKSTTRDSINHLWILPLRT